MLSLIYLLQRWAPGEGTSAKKSGTVHRIFDTVGKRPLRGRPTHCWTGLRCGGVQLIYGSFLECRLLAEGLARY